MNIVVWIWRYITNMKIYHDKLVDHQFIWCEYCNNACELLNERGFKSDLYIEHHWTIFIQFHPYSEKRTEVSPSIESMGIWSMICLAPALFSLRGLTVSNSRAVKICPARGAPLWLRIPSRDSENLRSEHTGGYMGSKVGCNNIIMIIDL